MRKVLNTDLIYEVLSVVEEIPEGRVATYGQIARLTGRDRNARLVGRILGMSEFLRELSLPPCGEPRRKNRAGVPGPAAAAGSGRRGVQGQRLCRPGKLSVGLLKNFRREDMKELKGNEDSV